MLIFYICVSFVHLAGGWTLVCWKIFFGTAVCLMAEFSTVATVISEVFKSPKVIWFLVYKGVGFPKLDWWNWVAEENVNKSFPGNACFYFLVVLFSAWSISVSRQGHSLIHPTSSRPIGYSWQLVAFFAFC